MATTNELLEEMEAEMLTGENDTFVVDNNLRTVSIPESMSVLGVEHDDDVHRLYFQIPKMYGDTDTAVTLQPNILYIFPEMSTLDVTIPETDQEIHFFFDSGATATTFSLQAQDGGQIYTDAYSIDANMRYKVSVLHSVACIKGVSMSEA